MIEDANLGYNKQIPMINDTFQFLEANRFKDQAFLTIIVGESGIGKSTAFKDYAKKLRTGKFPVNYVSIEPKKPFFFDTFLKDVFGNTDRTNFSNVIKKFSSTATLIIDNIHLAKYPDGTLNTELFVFLNGYLMQSLGMRIIMLGSQDRMAYEIRLSKISF